MIAAATGIIGDIVGWLILLGLLVPPIGGTIMADYYVIRAGSGFGMDRDRPINWAAILATAIGVIIAYWVNLTYPEFLFGAAGIMSSFVAYVVLAKLAPVALGAEIGRSPTGAQAEGVRASTAAAPTAAE